MIEHIGNPPKKGGAGTGSHSSNVYFASLSLADMVSNEPFPLAGRATSDVDRLIRQSSDEKGEVQNFIEGELGGDAPHINTVHGEEHLTSSDDEAKGTPNHELSFEEKAEFEEKKPLPDTPQSGVASEITAQEEEPESDETDSEVIAKCLGSRVTFGGCFTKGEFFTTPTTDNADRQVAKDEEDVRTLLHGYIHSLAVIMPPRSYHRKRKEDK